MYGPAASFWKWKSPLLDSITRNAGLAVATKAATLHLHCWAHISYASPATPDPLRRYHHLLFSAPVDMRCPCGDFLYLKMTSNLSLGPIQRLNVGGLAARYMKQGRSCTDALLFPSSLGDSARGKICLPLSSQLAPGPLEFCVLTSVTQHPILVRRYQAILFQLPLARRSI
jgi:hypothetical protein